MSTDTTHTRKTVENYATATLTRKSIENYGMLVCVLNAFYKFNLDLGVSGVQLACEQPLIMSKTISKLLREERSCSGTTKWVNFITNEETGELVQTFLHYILYIFDTTTPNITNTNSTTRTRIYRIANILISSKCMKPYLTKWTQLKCAFNRYEGGPLLFLGKRYVYHGGSPFEHSGYTFEDDIVFITRDIFFNCIDIDRHYRYTGDLIEQLLIGKTVNTHPPYHNYCPDVSIDVWTKLHYKLVEFLNDYSQRISFVNITDQIYCIHPHTTEYVKMILSFEYCLESTWVQRLSNICTQIVKQKMAPLIFDTQVDSSEFTHKFRCNFILFKKIETELLKKRSNIGAYLLVNSPTDIFMYYTLDSVSAKVPNGWLDIIGGRRVVLALAE